MYTVFSKKKVYYCNMTKTSVKGPYVFKPLVSLLPFQSIALSPAFIFEESGYFKSICRRRGYWIWFMMLACKLNVLPPPLPQPPQKDCGSSRSNFLIWLRCLLWWWTFKLSKSFVKYCLSTKSVKCVKPQFPLPVSTVPLFESTCLTVKSRCKRVTRPAMVERTLPPAPSPPSPTCTRKKQQQKWLAEPTTTSDVFYKHKFFR